jgi:hypothetical protein
MGCCFCQSTPGSGVSNHFKIECVCLRESFDQFVKEKRFLDNLTPQTIRSYNLAFQWFEKLGGEKE